MSSVDSARDGSVGWWVRLSLALAAGSLPFAVACVLRQVSSGERGGDASVAADLAVFLTIPVWILVASAILRVVAPVGAEH